MARTPFSIVPDSAPSTSVPEDYIRVQPTAGEALQGFGQTISRVGEFYNSAAADNASNQFQEGVTKILHGDATRTVIGPDGQPTQDTGYMGMKGSIALNGRPAAEKQINDLLGQIRSGLKNPEQQLAFDNFSRRYRANAFTDIGSHADQQAAVWYGDVNKASEQNALDEMARNPLDPQKFAAGAADLTNARVKQAQLAGAQPGDAVWQQAIDGAKKDALKVQVMTLSATDPARAMTILDKNRNIAGEDYQPLYDSIKGKADKAAGEGAGQAAIDAARTQSIPSAQAATAPIHGSVQQIIQQTAQRYGVDSDAMMKIAQIESGGNPNARNPTSSAGGLFQFTNGTAAQYGLKNKFDAAQASDAAARLMRDNSNALQKALGRAPSVGELYLAHQQGIGGAIKLLAHPNDLAVDVVGRQAVMLNGGNANMTAAQFANKWISRAGSAPANFTNAPNVQQSQPATNDNAPQMPRTGGSAPQVAVAEAATPIVPPPASSPTTQDQQPLTPAQIKAGAFQQILDNPNLTPEVRQHALQYVSQVTAAQEVADAANAAAKKERSDAAANTYMSRVLKGDTNGILDQISNDPNLDWHDKNSLAEATLKYAKDSTESATQTYGSGFWQAYQGVTAQPGNPQRITEMGDLLRRAGPGGDLTLAGVQKLHDIMGQAAKSPDQQAISGMQRATLDYVKHNLSFEADYGFYKIPDPAGMDIFNAQAIPAFWKSYQDGIDAGKTPFQLLSKDSPDFIGDKIISAYKRSDAQEAKDRIAAGEDVTNAGGETAAPPDPNKFDLTTAEGVVAAYKAGSISRADANRKLDMMRSQLSSPVPNQ